MFFGKRAFLYAAACAVVCAAAAFVYFAQEKPGRRADTDYSIRVTGADGALLREYLSPSGSCRRPLEPDSVSPWLLLAFVAAEDKRFFEHPGVDAKAVLRALWQNAKAGGTVSGASTITQQLARALQPRRRNLAGKIREMLRALNIERELDKKEILDSYANSVSYGNRIKGARAASEIYFGVAPSELTLSQAAFLSGIPKSPAKYDPVRRYAAALQRRDSVLSKMLAAGYITPELFDIALNEKIIVRSPEKIFIAPHFADYAVRHAAAQTEEIRTTVDPVLQAELERMVSAHIKSLRENNVTNAAAVVLDNKTGEVKAWVGSADFFNSANAGQVDGVVALRQPGSALKPFVYGLAMSKGKRASDLINDTPAALENGFIPKNYDLREHGLVRLREALACSYNLAAVSVAQELGAAAILAHLRAFGFGTLSENPEYYGCGIALGDGEVRLIDLVNAYAALVRYGQWRPWSVYKTRPAPLKRVLDERSAYLVTDILSDNNARIRAFTQDSPFNMPFAFAAKTGTSKDYKDNWAVGYTPRWTVGVWAGNFDASPMHRVSGITGAGPLLRSVALAVYKRYPSGAFPKPAGIMEADICPDSGSMAGHFCPVSIREVFSSKYPPDRECPVHRAKKFVPAARALVKKPAVVFPKNDDVFVIDPSQGGDAQEIKFQAESPYGAPFAWYIDGHLAEGNAAVLWWKLKAGEHSVRFEQVDADGVKKAPAVKFRVIGFKLFKN
ncbi:MAG: penicillin-binding protein 1C [Elusimicrobiaceae bacterium]